jgi:hypothetical protein
MTTPISLPSFEFCIPPNPSIGVLRSHAELNLRKLRSGRNIAGIQREVPAYAAATDTVTGMPVALNGQISLPGARTVKPTMHRYSVLIARAKELAQQAAQFEALFLRAIEQRDEAAYSLQKARQELTLAQAQVQLQNLRLTEANDAIKLAELQEQRAVIQFTTYQEWISRGLNEAEQLMLKQFEVAAGEKIAATHSQAMAQVALAQTTAATASGPEAAAAATAAAISATATLASAEFTSLATLAEVAIQRASLFASYQRRLDEWMLQSALANQDSQISRQQVTMARDQVQIRGQEKSIAETQVSQTRDTIEFLSNRFTGFDLYDWMSTILSDVYRSLLQQASVMAGVAQAQLAFERQEPSPAIIRMDYWAAPSSNPLATQGAEGEDRRGLTGSARLLGDIYQLDQYAFDTDKRKLAVTKTISLAQMAPAEFQRFRETGVIVFNTPMELFDRDFPGHYLRLIRRVRTSVIALIPPTEGIHATLSSTGISRTVIGPEPFQTVTIRREPETVALSAPIGSTGFLEMDGTNEMYLPFEGNGVDGTWELRLPKASNSFDFGTISDVLISVEYSALNSFDYREQVTRQLKPDLEADLAFSFKDRFPDAWYDLHNPESLEEPQRMVVQFEIGPDDFPPNLERIRMRGIMLYLARAEGLAEASQEVQVAHLKLIDAAGNEVVGGPASTIDGTISTRRGNGSNWLSLIGASAATGGRTPFGTWELSLRNPNAAAAQQLQDWLKDGQIEDILFVISYIGRTPAWPA